MSENDSAPLAVPADFPDEALDQDAVRVVERLVAGGHEAYLVGGCVRDLLFGLRPKDFDIATSAHPNEVRRAFRNCRIIGRRFRLAHVMFRDKIIEVATFRSGGNPDADAETGLGDNGDNGDAAAAQVDTSERGALLIRDDNVFGTAAEDARRRDFSINALFYDVASRTIVDWVGGVADARARVLRTIGDPQIRMREDPIRMLRAIRFAARMGCRIEAETYHAIRQHRHEISHAAAPRVLEDLLRMFRGGAIAPAFDLMRDTGVLDVVLPTLAAHLERSSADGRPQEAAALRRALAVADDWTRHGRQVSSAVQLSLLFAPVVMTSWLAAQKRGEKADGNAVAAGAVSPEGSGLAISRKDGERVRQVLTTLPKLAPQPARKAKATAALVRRAFFPETLDLFEITASATTDMVAEAAAWRRELAAVHPEGPHPAPRKRARRRGGRRRRD